MRLIDADKIDFGKVFIGASDFAKDTREAAQKLIDEQPTAYDMDKVVGQMEEYIKESSNVDYNRAMIEAIEIVKSGGIE
nr:hypothetical protein [uncultured Acetatifactor sp.]